MVSNLEELSRALRAGVESKDSTKNADFAAAFRSERPRIVNELQQHGEAELLDGKGNRFIIRRKSA